MPFFQDILHKGAPLRFERRSTAHEAIVLTIALRHIDTYMLEKKGFGGKITEGVKLI